MLQCIKQLIESYSVYLEDLLHVSVYIGLKLLINTLLFGTSCLYTKCFTGFSFHFAKNTPIGEIDCDCNEKSLQKLKSARSNQGFWKKNK